MELELSDAAVWKDPERAEKLGRERSSLQRVVTTVDDLQGGLAEADELLQLAGEEQDPELLKGVAEEVARLTASLEKLEFRHMFSGEMDENNAFLDIQAGSGGVEAQDWAEMLLRMFLRWGERKGFSTEIQDQFPGEVAGIRNATLLFSGEFAYGLLRTEAGVHRLVRKSPFDSGNRRHTSFASVSVLPELDDEIQVDLDMSDVRVDTYRASGAGGQHINKTDSAVRLTHLPTGLVVQCQSERSQHKNKDQAIKQLKAKMYQLEETARQKKKQDLEGAKPEITWGSQIRSYVLDSGRVKDLRTQVETSNTGAVLDGDLDAFIEASLKMGL